MYRDAAAPTLLFVLEPSVKIMVWLLQRWKSAIAFSFEPAMEIVNGVHELGWSGRGWMVSVVLRFITRFCIRQCRVVLWCFTGPCFTMQVTIGLSR